VSRVPLTTQYRRRHLHRDGARGGGGTSEGTGWVARTEGSPGYKAETQELM